MVVGYFSCFNFKSSESNFDSGFIESSKNLRYHHQIAHREDTPYLVLHYFELQIHTGKF